MIDWYTVLSGLPWWIYLSFILIIVLKAFEPTKKRYKKQYNKPKTNNKLEKIIMDEMSKEKGERYERHIANHFEKLGYKTVEHGKMHGVNDKGIDLMLKKGKEFLFVQCKDWNIKNEYRIDSKEIQYTRMNVRDYIEKKKELFNMYDWKILYITSDDILHKSAKYKIEEFNQEIEHRVIPI